MARIVGNEGSMTCSGHGITANAWSMSISRVVNDVTAFGDATSAFRGGVPTYTGSISGFMDDGTDPNLGSAEFTTGSEVDIVLIASAGNQYSGTAVISGASMSTSKTGDATLSLDFSFTGVVTEAWS